MTTAKILISNRCTYFCDYCNTRKIKLKPDEVIRYYDIIPIVKENKTIIISGGEPLFIKNRVKFIYIQNLLDDFRLKEKAYIKRTGIEENRKIILATNGFELITNPGLIEFKVFSKIQIYIHNKHQFDKIIRGFKTCQLEGIASVRLLTEFRVNENIIDTLIVPKKYKDKILAFKPNLKVQSNIKTYFLNED